MATLEHLTRRWRSPGSVRRPCRSTPTTGGRTTPTRPVAPFFELHGSWREDGATASGPLTTDAPTRAGSRLAGGSS